MRAVIETQAKKINPKTKITNSEYFSRGIECCLAPNNERKR